MHPNLLRADSVVLQSKISSLTKVTIVPEKVNKVNIVNMVNMVNMVNIVPEKMLLYIGCSETSLFACLQT